MNYIIFYKSPLGNIMLASDGISLTGLWFEKQKYFAENLSETYKEKKIPIFEETFNWLDIYFSGKQPDFTPKIKMVGTDFRKKVWQILLNIPYGKTITYKEIACIVAKESNYTRNIKLSYILQKIDNKTNIIKCFKSWKKQKS